MVTSVPAVSDFAVSASTLAGTSAAAVASVEAGSQPSSRSESRNRSVASSARSEPSISIRTPVSTGSMSSRPAAVTAWATALAKTSLRTVPVARRHVRQGRVLLDGHCLQAEPGAAAGQRDLGALDRHLHRLVRQAAADVGEQPAGDQSPALLDDLRRQVARAEVS